MLLNLFIELDLQVVDRRGADGLRRDDITLCAQSLHPIVLIAQFS